MQFMNHALKLIGLIGLITKTEKKIFHIFLQQNTT